MAQQVPGPVVRIRPRSAPAMVPVAGVARGAVVLLAVAAAVEVLALHTDLTVWRDTPAPWSARRSWAASTQLQAFALLLTAMPFLVWFRRARDNAELIAPGSQRMKPGWAYGAWAIPIASLVLPKRVANDMWSAGIPGRRTLLTAWWYVWLASIAALSTGDVLADEAHSSADLTPALVAYTFGDALGLAAAVLAVFVVRRLTANQLRLLGDARR